MRIVFAIAFVIALVYGQAELRRWRMPEMQAVLTPQRRLRRGICFGALLLVVAMAFGGTFFPVHHVSRRMVIDELAYWCVCLVIAAVIPLVAIREFRNTLKQESLRDAAAERDAAYLDAVDAVKEAEQRADRIRELPKRNGHG